MSGSILRTIAISVPEAVILWFIWMAYVSNPQRPEIIAGVGAAMMAAVADAVVKERRIVEFFPRVKWLALVFLESWYAVEGTWKIFLALFKRVLGKRSEADFAAIQFDPGGNDDASQARRALAVTYLTMTPTFVVIGIDRKKRKILLHQISPSGVPFIAKQLGAKE